MAANHVQKKKPANFLSSMRHAVATITKDDMNLKKELFIYTLLTSKYTPTYKQIYFLLTGQTLFSPKAIYKLCFLFVFTFSFMHIKLFVVYCSLCPIPFLLCDYKKLCCICGGNNIESNTRKIPTKTHLHAYQLQ